MSDINIKITDREGVTHDDSSYGYVHELNGDHSFL